MPTFSHNIRASLWISCLWLALSGPGFARQVEMDVQPRVLRLNETAVLKLIFKNAPVNQAPAFPGLNGFTIQYTGQESQFQFINGAQERRMTCNYILQPQATGKFTIGPFDMTLDGQAVSFNAVEVEVLPPTGEGESQTQTINDLVFARISLPKTDVYFQERFDIELALFYRGVQLDRGVQLLNLPGTGLHIDNIEELGAAREQHNGEIYEVRRFRMRGTALNSGDFELKPALRVNVLVRRERSRDPFFAGFEDFFSGGYDARPLNVPTDGVRVNIKPLPAENKPDDFAGAVGQFDMQLDVKPRELTAGEPVTLTVSINGRGNIENISMPEIKLGDQFRTYEPKLVAADGSQKVFEQIVIPRSEQVAEIPPVAFSYFDPVDGSYHTITRGPEKLAVRPGETAPQMVQGAQPANPGENRAPLGVDILDIKRNRPSESDRIEKNDLMDPVLHLTPLLALGGLLIWRRQRDQLSGDVARQRKLQAPRSARIALRAAEAALEARHTGDFYQALWQSMADYLAHRANLQPGQVSPDLTLEKCRAGGMPDAQVDELAELIALFDEARFARGDAPLDRELARKHFQQTQQFLRAMEKTRIR